MQSVHDQSIADDKQRISHERFAGWLPKLALAIWGVVVLVAGSFLMTDHWVTLPIPSGEDPKLAQAIDDSRHFHEQGQWLAVHFLYSKCTCSQRIVDHLFAEDRLIGIKEKLIIVDGERPEWVRLAKARGFSYEVISPEDLRTHYNIQAAPLMVVADPLGKVHYAGGYTARKQGPDIRDAEIITRVMTNHPVKPIPLFGCAIAKGLQKLVDPFGFKY